MAAQRPLSFDKFKEVYSTVPRVSVDLLIETPKGVVLTLRTVSSWNNQWHFPGVTVLYKESVEEAVRRAARDEAGIVVNIKKMLGYLEYPSEQRERGFGSTVSLLFLCEHAGGELVANEDAAVIKTFSSLADLPANIIAEHRPILEQYFNGDF